MWCKQFLATFGEETMPFAPITPVVLRRRPRQLALVVTPLNVCDRKLVVADDDPHLTHDVLISTCSIEHSFKHKAYASIFQWSLRKRPQWFFLSRILR